MSVMERVSDQARYIARHGFTVLAMTENEITAVSVSYSAESGLEEVPETIPATWEAVREWLGY